MIEIKAYIRPNALAKVTLALHEIEGVTGMSAVDLLGFGRSRAKNSSHSFMEDMVDYIPGVKIEIVCRDDLAEQVISTIRSIACTGNRGDGKIYISTVDDAIRIETGERGEQAV